MVAAVIVDLAYDWRADASCRGLAFVGNPEDSPFFKVGKGHNYGTARRFCAGCPVVIDCLLEGIREDNKEGFWGFTSPNERDKIRSRLSQGMDFKRAVEMTWNRSRRAGRPAPPKSVWNEWE